MPVLDSSIFASVVVKDEFYLTAMDYLRDERITLDLAYAEAGNVVWKHSKRLEDPIKRIELLKKIISASKVYRASDFIVEALKISLKHNITIYDSLFLALALEHKEKLVTTDAKLYEVLKGTELEKTIFLIR